MPTVYSGPDQRYRLRDAHWLSSDAWFNQRVAKPASLHI